MKKVLFVMVLLLCLSASGLVFGQTSVNLGISYGEKDSLVYDAHLQHQFEPWLESDQWEVAPFLTGGMTFWDHNDSSDSLWGVLAAFGLKVSYTGFNGVEPFFSLNGGPSYVSQKFFVDRNLGGHFLFNSRLMIGLAFGDQFRHNFAIHGSHFSNGHTQNVNEGFNYSGVIYGYSF